jgi:hypothetical protein
MSFASCHRDARSSRIWPAVSIGVGSVNDPAAPIPGPAITESKLGTVTDSAPPQPRAAPPAWFPTRFAAELTAEDMIARSPAMSTSQRYPLIAGSDRRRKRWSRPAGKWYPSFGWRVGPALRSLRIRRRKEKGGARGAPKRRSVRGRRDHGQQFDAAQSTVVRWWPSMGRRPSAGQGSPGGRGSPAGRCRRSDSGPPRADWEETCYESRTPA